MARNETRATTTPRIDVECYAGYKAAQEPRAFKLGAQRRIVLGIGDRWHGPSSTWFKVRADDGHLYLLCHDRAHDRWSLVRRFEQDA